MLDFDAAYAEHHADLLRLTTARCGDVQTAADIVAETWAKAWRRRASYDPARGTAGAWLYRICTRTSQNYFRGKRVKLVSLYWSDEPAAPADDLTDDQSDVTNALNKLPEPWADAIRALYLEDRTLPQAAEVLGCSPGTVYNRAKQGLQRLRKILAA